MFSVEMSNNKAQPYGLGSVEYVCVKRELGTAYVE
jgi:hypothetical protein